MELMAAVLEVSLGEIKETVKRDRCDWLAAIYNLLIDQPEGRIAMNKLLCNAEKDGSEISSADPFDGSSSGFSQNLSQGMLCVCVCVCVCVCAGMILTFPPHTETLHDAQSTPQHSERKYCHFWYYL